MRARTATPLVLAALAPLAVSVAMATPPTGLSSQLLARGGAEEIEIDDERLGLEVEAERATDVAVVRANLNEGGTTGWHGHPGPSLVVVKTGAITVVEAARDGAERCSVHEYKAGAAFTHSKHAHTFVNSGQGQAEFYVIYLVPAKAAPLLNDVTPAPRGCP